MGHNFMDTLAPTGVVEDGGPEALARTVRRGVGWSLLNGASARFLSVACGMVIARLVTPHQFGVYAVGLLVLAALTSMNELGVSVAVQRWPSDPRELTPTATTLSLATSVLIYVVVFAVAPDLATAIGTPAAVTVIRLIGLNVILDGLSAIPNAMLMRSFQQGRRAIVDVGAFFPGAAVSIGLAAAGWGPMALVWGSLAGNVTAVTLVYLLAPCRPLPGWRGSDAGALVKCGLPFAATSAVYLATLNVDYVVVGRVLGTTALGLYLLAFNLSTWPANLVSLSIRRVSIPAFSRLADDPPELSRVFARSLHLVMIPGVLMALLMSMLGGPVVQLFYGHEWLHAVAALRWLAVLGGVRVALDLGYDVLVAAGKGRTLLFTQLAWFVGLIIALPIGAQSGGIRGVGIAHVVVAVGIVVPAYAIALRRSGLRLRAAGSALIFPLLAGAGACTVLALALHAEGDPWLRLFLGGSAGGLVYLGVVGFQRDNRAVLARTVSRLRPQISTA